jgi:hypothetical protein
MNTAPTRGVSAGGGRGTGAEQNRDEADARVIDQQDPAFITIYSTKSK